MPPCSGGSNLPQHLARQPPARYLPRVSNSSARVALPARFRRAVLLRELRTIRADPNFFETGRPGGIEVLEWLRSKNLSSYAPLFAHHDIVCNPTLFSHVMVLRDCIWGTNGFVLKQSRGFDSNHSCGVLITAML